jgi:hypothetical protein
MPRWRQQLGGLFFMLLAGGFTIWEWHTARNEGDFTLLGGMFFPAVGVLGLAMILFKGYREERTGRGEDISRMRGWELLTTRWRVILVVALLVGIGNCIFLAVAS